jgi:flagellar biosynthesis/type III secretory pathway M-ring protein FliF/YscJ
MEIKVNHKTPDEFTTTPIDKLPEEKHEEILKEVNKPPQFGYIIAVVIMVVYVVISLIILISTMSAETLDSLSSDIDKNDVMTSIECGKIAERDQDSQDKMRKMYEK